MDLIPEDISRKNLYLILTLAILGFVGLSVLSAVVRTIFFAVVAAYVLYPVKERIHRESLSDRQSAALVTFSAFAAIVAALAPVLTVLFRRRNVFVDFLASLPEELSFEVASYSFVYSTAELEVFGQELVNRVAVSFAEVLPSLFLKIFLFVFLLYAILRHPKSIEEKLLAVLPDSSQEILKGYHERVRKTLVGIFAVQTFTAVVTFLIALPVFYMLGYQAFIALALIAATLQFIPLMGPAVLIIALAGLELMAGFALKAVSILLFGVIVIGLLPDAYFRPMIANRTTGIPASLYFVGFAGGALTLGPIGVLAGPLTIALILETIELLAEVEN